jgi:hypothetical protein
MPGGLVRILLGKHAAVVGENYVITDASHPGQAPACQAHELAHLSPGALRHWLGVGAEDGVDQAGEAVVQVVLPQAHVALGALHPLGDDPGLAQDAKVTGPPV